MLHWVRKHKPPKRLIDLYQCISHLINKKSKNVAWKYSRQLSQYSTLPREHYNFFLLVLVTVENVSISVMFFCVKNLYEKDKQFSVCALARGVHFLFVTGVHRMNAADWCVRAQNRSGLPFFLDVQKTCY